ncbi:MAG: hypothetical protein JO257_11850 [Deltaproteobacteria bacterium]|nr:hypothetical protein [Deltaproteobacteria bacterium]
MSDSKQRPTTAQLRTIEAQERDAGRERTRVAERAEAHRRWIGGEPDDPCCRGFD